VSGSPGSLQALRHAAGLAREHAAALIVVLAWIPPGGEIADRRCPSIQLRRVWAEAAWKRLWDSVDVALGGVPDDVIFEAHVLRGQPREMLVGCADEGDLLVIGAGRRGQPGRLLACRVGSYCIAHARCPVIAVPPSELAPLSHGLRGWARRHRRLHLSESELSSDF
jgi:nucleotide-binding universal stress UspA family protein